MSGLLDAVQTLQDGIQAAIQSYFAAQNPALNWDGQVVPGWAVSTELAAILGKGNHNFLVVIWPTTTKNCTRYSPQDSYNVEVATGTPTIAVSANVATFSGSFTSAITVNALVNGKIVTVPAAAQSLSSLATLVANAIATAGITGVGATASGADVTVTGAYQFECTISGMGTVSYEVGRDEQGVLVTVYGPDPFTRLTVGEAIRTKVGTALSHSLTMSDGNEMMVLRDNGGGLCEKAQSSYSAYEWALPFMLEYPLIETVTTYQVGVVETNTTIDNQPSSTT